MLPFESYDNLSGSEPRLGTEQVPPTARPQAHRECTRYSLFVVLLAIVTLVPACVSTSVTSLVHPDFETGSVQSLVVASSIQDLDLRIATEQRIAEEMAQYTTCRVLKAIDLFFPGQDYSDSEVREVLLTSNVDAVLLVRPVDSGTTEARLPDTARTTTDWSVVGGSIRSSSTTVVTPGATLTKPWEKAVAELSTIEGASLWYATIRSGGSAFSSWEDVVESTASGVVREAIQDGVFPLSKLGRVECYTRSLAGKAKPVTTVRSRRARIPIGSTGSPLEISIVARTGQLVRSITVSDSDRSSGFVSWNCRSDAGTQLPEGNYDYLVFDSDSLLSFGRLRVE